MSVSPDFSLCVWIHPAYMFVPNVSPARFRKCIRLTYTAVLSNMDRFGRPFVERDPRNFGNYQLLPPHMVG